MSKILIMLSIVLGLQLLAPTAIEDKTTVPPSENPLLDMLALIPDTPDIAEAPPGFVDYEALRSVYPEIATFSSWAEWNAAQEAEDREAARIWQQQMLRLSTGPAQFLRYLDLGDRTSGLIGFDFFDVDRALQTGFPPTMLTIYQGDIQPERVTAAYEARDYHATDVGVATLLSTGEDGMVPSLEDREPANPFGGDLGRKEPLAVLADTVIGGPSDALLDTVIETVNGEHSSLLNQDPLVAIAEAIYAQDATPLQVQYLNVESAFAPQSPAGAGPLPGYAGAAIADMQLDSEQVAVVTLAYTTQEEAQIAAAELSSRFVTMTMPGGSDALILDAVEDATIHEPQVFQSESTGLYVVVGMISYSSPISGDGSPPRDGLITSQWSRAYLFHEFALLAVVE